MLCAVVSVTPLWFAVLASLMWSSSFGAGIFGLLFDLAVFLSLPTGVCGILLVREEPRLSFRVAVILPSALGCLIGLFVVSIGALAGHLS
jgi:hypothetical protein